METNALGSFIDAVKGGLGDFSTGTLSTVLVAALGVTVALVIGWFAYRFITRKVAGALKKGKM